MFVSKISAIHNNMAFKSCTPQKDAHGDLVYKTNIPGGSENSYIEYFYVNKQNGGWIKSEPQTCKSGEFIEPDCDFDGFAYRIADGNDKYPDSGKTLSFDNQEYTFINTKCVTPLASGASILTMHDISRPGAIRSKDGEIIYNADLQKQSEDVSRNYGNKGNGTLAGLIYNVPLWAQAGFKNVFTTPFSDGVSGHGYWVENLMQTAGNVGTRDDLREFNEKLFQFGMQRYIDSAYTSEGIQGMHFQRLLRLANSEEKPMEYYMFTAEGLDGGTVSIGILPQNDKNVRFRVINAPQVFDDNTQRIKSNSNYQANSPTLINLYDESQTTEEQLKKEDELILTQGKPQKNPLAIASFNDTVVNYALPISPEEYTGRLRALKTYNAAHPDAKIKFNSPEGLTFIAQFKNFVLSNETKGVRTWCSNKDIILRNLYVSSYIDEYLQYRYPDAKNKQRELELYLIGACMNQDMNIQHIRKEIKTAQNDDILYAAKVIGKKTTEEEIRALCNDSIPDIAQTRDEITAEAKPLPKAAMLTQETIDNILDDDYSYVGDEYVSKDEITLNALMATYLDELEFHQDTASILSSQYFTNRATSEDTIGKTRFELYKDNNPQFDVNELCQERFDKYKSIYSKMDKLYENELKQFTDKIIQKINSKSEEKLLDTNGNYTEYGKEVINHQYEDIIRYAFFKAVLGEKLKVDSKNGHIIYDYDDIKQNSSLQALGIYAKDENDEAKELFNIIQNGMKRLSDKDTDFVANAIAENIKGTTTSSFKIARAIAPSVNVRIDAAKDWFDIDAVQKGDVDCLVAIKTVTKMLKKYVDAIRQEAPNANIVPELTNLMDLYYEQDREQQQPEKKIQYEQAIANMLTEAGMISETSYSQYFSSIPETFSANFENGQIKNNGAYKPFEEFVNIVKNSGMEYARNLYTFLGNHDKPSFIQSYAIDMSTFYSNFAKQDDRINCLLMNYNVDDVKDLPIEARLNINNPAFFSAANSKQYAVLKLMTQVIGEIPYNLTNTQKKYLRQALSDLFKCQYLDDTVGETALMTFEEPELVNVEDALHSVVKMTNSNISENRIKEITEEVKQRINNDEGFLNYHIIQNDDNTKRDMLAKFDISENASDFQFYQVSLAHLLYEALERYNDFNNEKLKQAAGAFLQKHGKKISPHFIPNNKLDDMKNAFAYKDFRTTLKMLLEQAQYRAKENGETFCTEDELKNIYCKMFKAMTEPAIQKALDSFLYLTLLTGNPTLFERDMLCSLGLEGKCKNQHLDNRGTVTWSELEGGVEDKYINDEFRQYIKKIYTKWQTILRLRSEEGMEALNNGTFHNAMATETPQGLRTYLFENGDDDYVYVALNMKDMSPNYRQDFSYITNNERESINNDNKYVQRIAPVSVACLSLGLAKITLGTKFINPLSKDGIEYVCKLQGNKPVIARVDGKDIKIADAALVLAKKVVKKGLSFKGRQINKQYNIVSNPYCRKELPQEGQKLSLLAK